MHENWKPSLRNVLVEHLEHITGAPLDAVPSAFMHPSLRNWSFGTLFLGFLTRRPPPLHTGIPETGDLWRAVRRHCEMVVLGEKTIELFREELEKLKGHGPLALDVDGEGGLLGHVAPLPPCDPREFPEGERELLRKFGLVPPGEPSGPDGPGREGPLSGYLKRKLELIDRVSGGLPESAAMPALALARRLALRGLAGEESAGGNGRAGFVDADNGLPVTGNEAILWTASLQTALVSVLLEHVCQHRRYRRARQPLVEKAVEEFSGGGGWAVATVGDLLWMRALYSRWLRRDGTDATGGLALACLGRNPLFLLENIDTALARYPDDAAGRHQLLVFLATCPHHLRKSLVEDLFAKRGKEEPWKGCERAGRWVNFLRQTVRDWALEFTPLNPDAGPTEEETARRHFGNVVRLWEAHTLRTGLARSAFLDAGKGAPEGIRALFTPDELAQSAQDVAGSLTRERRAAGVWMNLPSVPLTYAPGLMDRFLSLPELPESPPPGTRT